MKYVGRVPKKTLDETPMVRLDYEPFHVLVARVGLRYYAIEDGCNHAGASLCEGFRVDDRVVCPVHAYVFDIKTGKLLQPEELCDDQRTFVCEEQGSDVVVWDPGVLTIRVP